MDNWKSNRTYIVLIPKSVYHFLPPVKLISESIGGKNIETSQLLFGLDFSDFPQNIFYFPKSFKYTVEEY